jgi:L,D-peptidoglycan transpeptidase YkuD (ErfK/YbiS/YcfS/YnhG family)
MRKMVVGLLISLLAGCAPPPPGPDGISPTVVPTGSNEVILVRPHGEKPFQVELTAWARFAEGRPWIRILPLTAGVIGPKGFAPPGEKREGDGRTPTGVYRIATAFGYQKDPSIDLDFRVTTADDFWVDDPDSPQYNRWVHGKPDAKSFETLRIDAYKYAAIIEYNTDPVVPGHGSAIFLHIWGGPDKPTAGCVALDESNVRELLSRLENRLKPVIVLNP